MTYEELEASRKRWEEVAYAPRKLDPSKSVRIDSRRRMDLREFHIKCGNAPEVVDAWINGKELAS